MDTKKWWQSSTIWAGVVLILTSLVEIATVISTWAANGAKVEEVLTTVVPGIVGIVVVYLRRRTNTVIQ